MKLINADDVLDLIAKVIYVNNGIEERTEAVEQELRVAEYFYDRINSMSYIEPRLMKCEECAGHSIEYAMGWRACIKWLESGGDNQYFSTDKVPKDLTEKEIAEVKKKAEELKGERSSK